MPHAKTHEHPEPMLAPKIVAKPFPWRALAIGGALAGVAITAALTLRPSAKPAKRRVARKTVAKPRAKTTRKPRAPKAAAAE